MFRHFGLKKMLKKDISVTFIFELFLEINLLVHTIRLEGKISLPLTFKMLYLYMIPNGFYV